MMARSGTRSVIIALAFLLGACGADVNQSALTASLQSQVFQLFEKKCNECHSASAYVAATTSGCAGGIGSFENRPLGSVIIGGALNGIETGCDDRTLMERLVNLPSLNCPEESLVVPGDSSQGLLMKKLRSTSASPTYCDDGTEIPPLKGSVDPSDVILIEQWINEMK